MLRSRYVTPERSVAVVSEPAITNIAAFVCRISKEMF